MTLPRPLPVLLLVLILACSGRSEAPGTAQTRSEPPPVAAPEPPPEAAVAPILAATPDSGPPAGRLLVAVTVEVRRGVTFEPVYFLPMDGPPRPYPPGLDTGVAAFEAMYANPARSYAVLEGGDLVGTLHPTGAFESSCTGHSGSGHITPAPGEKWAGLAITGSVAASRWRRRELTAREQLALRQFARPHLLALEASPAGADSALIDRGFAYKALDDDVRLLAAALHHDELRSGQYHERLSVLIIAREDSTGYLPVYSWSHGGVEESHQSRDLIDAADLDGDGQLEFVTRLHYYESHEYRVVQANGGEWSQGAAEGC